MQRPILAIVRERNVALHCADAWCNEIIAGVQGEVRGKTAKKKKVWVACKAATLRRSAKRTETRSSKNRKEGDSQ